MESVSLPMIGVIDSKKCGELTSARHSSSFFCLLALREKVDIWLFFDLVLMQSSRRFGHAFYEWFELET